MQLYKEMIAWSATGIFGSVRVHGFENAISLTSNRIHANEVQPFETASLSLPILV